MQTRHLSKAPAVFGTESTYYVIKTLLKIRLRITGSSPSLGMGGGHVSKWENEIMGVERSLKLTRRHFPIGSHCSGVQCKFGHVQQRLNPAVQSGERLTGSLSRLQPASCPHSDLCTSVHLCNVLVLASGGRLHSASASAPQRLLWALSGPPTPRQKPCRVVSSFEGQRVCVLSAGFSARDRRGRGPRRPRS